MLRRSTACGPANWFATPYRASAQGVMFFVVRTATGLLSYFFLTLLAVTGPHGRRHPARRVVDRRASDRRRRRTCHPAARRCGRLNSNATAPRFPTSRLRGAWHGARPHCTRCWTTWPSNCRHGHSGTRHPVWFSAARTPRTVEEKIADAATVHRPTAWRPRWPRFIPWDAVDDYAALERRC